MASAKSLIPPSDGHCSTSTTCLTSPSCNMDCNESDKNGESTLVLSATEEYVGHLLTEGRHLHRARRLRCVYDADKRAIIVFGKEGKVKHNIQVLKVQVFRKAADDDAHLLEFVSEGLAHTVKCESRTVLEQWYTRLQQAKLQALREEEEKTMDQPKYARQPAKSKA